MVISQIPHTTGYISTISSIDLVCLYNCPIIKTTILQTLTNYIKSMSISQPSVPVFVKENVMNQNKVRENDYRHRDQYNLGSAGLQQTDAIVLETLF